MSNATIAGPSTGNVGFDPETTDRWLMNRTGAARIVGDFVMVDHAALQAEVTTGEPSGGTASIYGTATPAVTAHLGYGVGAIVLTAAADNAIMKVRFRGRVKANVVGTGNGGGGVTLEGDGLHAANGADTLTSAVASTDTVVKVYAISEAVTAAATEEQITVWFDGIHGFGTKADTTT